MKKYFDTLGLKQDASQEQIQEAYDRLSKELNPSNNDNQAFFVDEYEKVQEAHKALSKSSILKNREELFKLIKVYKNKYSEKKNVQRQNNWSGWNLSPLSIEFWLDGDNRIHERLKYTKDSKGDWIKSLLSP